MEDLDILYELGLIDRDEWLISRWRLEMGAFELVSGRWVAERVPDLHGFITGWIGRENYYQYHIDRDLVLHLLADLNWPFLKPVWHGIILKRLETCPE